VFVDLLLEHFMQTARFSVEYPPRLRKSELTGWKWTNLWKIRTRILLGHAQFPKRVTCRNPLGQGGRAAMATGSCWRELYHRSARQHLALRGEFQLERCLLWKFLIRIGPPEPQRWRPATHLLASSNSPFRPYSLFRAESRSATRVPSWSPSECPWESWGAGG